MDVGYKHGLFGDRQNLLSHDHWRSTSASAGFSP
jgi:hypothetical protein